MSWNVLLIKEFYNTTSVKEYYQIMRIVVHAIVLSFITELWKIATLAIVQQYSVYMNIFKICDWIQSSVFSHVFMFKHKAILFLWTFSIYLMDL